jgi:enterochelin esterase family protein
VEVRGYTVESQAFGAARPVTAILPEAYHRRRRRYPVVYLHDGSADWLGRGALLEAIREAGVPDFIVVLPEPADRTREYKLSEIHLRFLADEVVPWADRALRTLPRPEHRAVHGVSLGGLVSVALGLRRPELFARAGGQGGAFWYWKQRVVREALSAVGCRTRFHLTCGRGDGNLSDNRALHQAFERVGIEHEYLEVAGRHTWACWHRTLPAALRYYLGSR